MKLRGWKQWLAAGIVGAGLLVGAGPFVYFRFIQGDAPPPLAIPSSTPTATATTPARASSVDGTWNVTEGSQVGYRIKELLFGQSNEAVGRTSSVEGSVVIDGTTVRSGSFTADMTTVTSDEDRRDNQFRGRIMETSTYPTGMFTLTEPIVLGSIPDDGVQDTARATGDLTLHGVTRTVTFDVTGRRTGDTIQISGSIPVIFADYNISNPSFGPAQTEDNGSLEFLLVFARA